MLLQQKRLLVLVSFAAATAACAPPHVRLSHVAGPRACAAAVDAAGRLSAEPVSWLRPDDPGDRQVLDAWCDVVGPVVVRRAAAPGGPASALAVVTWNARVGGGDLAGLVGALRGGLLTGGRPVAHFVLLVQEAFRSGPAVPPASRDPRVVPGRIATAPARGAREDVVRAAERLDLHLYYVPSMRNGPGETLPLREDRGNAILSTLPLDRLEALELPFERQRRVAITARLSGTTGAGDPWAMRVVNVHLDNRAGASRLWLRSAAARARQAAALVEHLPADLPLVLGGDLNTWMGDSEPALAMMRKAFPSATPAAGAPPTFAGGLRLDYLFDRIPAGWRMTQRRVDDRFASDHHPILGELRIR